MIIAAPTIFHCPCCNTRLLRRRIASGNTFGARYYSDGKVEAPMLPRMPDLISCPSCSEFLWLSDLEETEIDDFPFFHVNLPEGPETGYYVEHPSLKELWAAFGAGLNNTPRHEKDLYTLIWWAVNDLQRGAQSQVELEEKERDRYHAVLELLLPHLDPSIPYENLQAAEIHRVQGRFDQALSVLNQLPITGDWSTMRILVKQACEKGESQLLSNRSKLARSAPPEGRLRLP